MFSFVNKCITEVELRFKRDRIISGLRIKHQPDNMFITHKKMCKLNCNHMLYMFLNFKIFFYRNSSDGILSLSSKQAPYLWEDLTLAHIRIMYMKSYNHCVSIILKISMPFVSQTRQYNLKITITCDYFTV